MYTEPKHDFFKDIVFRVAPRRCDLNKLKSFIPKSTKSAATLKFGQNDYELFLLYAQLAEAAKETGVPVSPWVCDQSKIDGALEEHWALFMLMFWETECLPVPRMLTGDGEMKWNEVLPYSDFKQTRHLVERQFCGFFRDKAYLGAPYYPGHHCTMFMRPLSGRVFEKTYQKTPYQSLAFAFRTDLYADELVRQGVCESVGEVGVMMAGPSAFARKCNCIEPIIPDDEYEARSLMFYLCQWIEEAEQWRSGSVFKETETFVPQMFALLYLRFYRKPMPLNGMFRGDIRADWEAIPFAAKEAFAAKCRKLLVETRNRIVNEGRKEGLKEKAQKRREERVMRNEKVKPTKILAMADLHGGGLKDLNLEGCDILVLAGDICPDAAKESPAGEWKYEGRKTKLEWLEDCFFNWCREHSDIKIVLTLGNRDKFILEKPLDKIEWPDNVTCLVDEMKVVNGIKFYGTPWVSIKKDLLAAGYRGNGVYEGTPIDLRVNYEKIPAGVDILICHETPAGVDSEINVGIDKNTGKPTRYGSDILAEQIRRACPKLVLCGHIHAASHRMSHLKDHFDTAIINVSRPIGYDRRGLLKAAEPRVIEVAKRNGDVEIRPVYNETLDGHQFREIFTAGEYYADTCPFEKDTVEADFWELEFSVLNSYGLNADEMDRKGTQMLRRKQCPREIRDADWPEWAKVQAAAMYDLADDWDDEQDKRDLATGMGDPDRPLYVNLPWGDYFKGPEK